MFCPKCGSINVSVTFMKKDQFVNQNEFEVDKEIIKKDYLFLKCRKCSYYWVEMTHDKKNKHDKHTET